MKQYIPSIHSYSNEKTFWRNEEKEAGSVGRYLALVFMISVIWACFFLLITLLACQIKLLYLILFSETPGYTDSGTGTLYVKMNNSV